MSCRKVVIIDDEPIICNLIKRLGEWDRLNLEIVGSATDGLEGYRLIRELHPDIVLLDIRMPGLDGLELIEKCSEEKLTPRFIIISGYQEFEYAKKAIHFNISDYLVKPIDREELNMALKKSCLAIEEAQQKQTALQSLQMTIKEKNMHLWRAFFEKIIKGEPVPNFPDSYTLMPQMMPWATPPGRRETRFGRLRDARTSEFISLPHSVEYPCRRNCGREPGIVLKISRWPRSRSGW